MHGLLQKWLIATVGATVGATGSALALGQCIQPASPPMDTANSQPADPAHPTSSLALEAPRDQVTSTTLLNAAEEATDAESPMAELEARLNSLAEEHAVAKKKAAGKPSVSVGGRILADWALFHQSPANRAQYGDFQDGCEFRQVRIFLKGEAFRVVDYKLNVDFADKPSSSVAAPGTLQSTAFNDVYITINELPLLGHVRIGHFKEPFSLEGLTAVKYLTFMERSLGVDPFYLRWTVGVMAFDQWLNERMGWAVGAFRTEMGSEPPIRQNDNGGTSLTTRTTFLPWYDEASSGRALLHTGVAYSYRDVDDATARFCSRPEAHLAPYVVDTGEIDGVDYWQQLGFEAALVYGPFSAQTEYCAALVHRPGAAQLDVNGVYVYVSYFLTGENRVYNRSSGTFGRVKPFENFFRECTRGGGTATGKGAWEVAYRYSYIDLNDADVLGGRASSHTLGLNWHLNPYTRITWNYVQPLATPSTVPESRLNVFEMRAQIEF